MKDNGRQPINNVARLDMLKRPNRVEKSAFEVHQLLPN
jgi:hypothetical protein